MNHLATSRTQSANPNLRFTETNSFVYSDKFEGEVREPQSLHKYAYVHGDPIGNVDPSGLMTLGSVLSGVTIGTLLIGMNNAIFQSIERRSNTGLGGQDITKNLISLMTAIKNNWDSRSVASKEYLIDYMWSPFADSTFDVFFPFISAWEINELSLFPPKAPVQTNPIQAYRTVTVQSGGVGKVFYAHEVNYWLFGYINGLAYADGLSNSAGMIATGWVVGVYRPVTQYLAFDVELQRSWLYRRDDGNTRGRTEWAHAGWMSAAVGGFIPAPNAALPFTTASGTIFNGRLTVRVGDSSIGGNLTAYHLQERA